MRSANSVGTKAEPLRLTRRSLLRAAALVGASGLVGGTASAAVRPASARITVQIAPGLTIAERSQWADGLDPVGELESESPGDVRFLLVHHTASRNTYSPAEVAAELRGFFNYHTSAEKGWPDLAYNFMVDRFGGVWEGRAGSLTAPVKGSATGGSQGFDQLACYIGDFTSELPPPEARAAMIALLAWLADRYEIDTSDGATATFVSRGSNRWPEGTTVTTPTISGHRDMSQTLCPGDPVYADMQAAYARDVSAVRASTRPSPTVVPSDPPASTASPAPTSPASSAATAGESPSVDTPNPPSPSEGATGTSTAVASAADDDNDDLWTAGSLVAAAAVAGTAAAAVYLRRGGAPPTSG